MLHSPAAHVERIDSSLRTLVADMFETMDEAPGVGLAAPQVGVGLRLYVYTYDADSAAPFRGVVINPELWMEPPTPGEPNPATESEGCLSFPGHHFPLRRAHHVRVTGRDLDGAPVEIDVTGWRARIMQHEFDHLNGYLYVNRLIEPYHSQAMEIAQTNHWEAPGSQWLPGRESWDRQGAK